MKSKTILTKLWNTHKIYWIYGGSVGILTVLLEIIQFKVMIREMSMAISSALVGILFLILGLWLGSRSLNSKEQRREKAFDHTKIGLSTRETEVLELLSQGLSNQEIADRLYVSLNTAKTHISSIYSKLNVKRRMQAVQKARELGLKN